LTHLLFFAARDIIYYCDQEFRLVAGEVFIVI